MFGTVRSTPSASTVEWLEQERQPSKLLKHDSLSIYEATLMKLKQGSRRSLISEHNSNLMVLDSMDFESSSTKSQDVSVNIVGVCSERKMMEYDSSSDGSRLSVESSPNQEAKGKVVSILDLFSRYNSSHQKQGSSSRNHSTLTSVSGCSSDSESTGCSKHLM